MKTKEAELDIFNSDEQSAAFVKGLAARGSQHVSCKPVGAECKAEAGSRGQGGRAEQGPGDTPAAAHACQPGQRGAGPGRQGRCYGTESQFAGPAAAQQGEQKTEMLPQQLHDKVNRKPTWWPSSGAR